MYPLLALTPQASLIEAIVPSMPAEMVAPGIVTSIMAMPEMVTSYVIITQPVRMAVAVKVRPVIRAICVIRTVMVTKSIACMDI